MFLSVRPLIVNFQKLLELFISYCCLWRDSCDQKQNNYLFIWMSKIYVCIACCESTWKFMIVTNTFSERRDDLPVKLIILLQVRYWWRLTDHPSGCYYLTDQIVKRMKIVGQVMYFTIAPEMSNICAYKHSKWGFCSGKFWTINTFLLFCCECRYLKQRLATNKRTKLILWNI